MESFNCINHLFLRISRTSVRLQLDKLTVRSKDRCLVWVFSFRLQVFLEAASVRIPRGCGLAGAAWVTPTGGPKGTPGSVRASLPPLLGSHRFF